MQSKTARAASARGVSVWMDSLSREMLETGELARLNREDAVVGVTSNPTIFQKAMAEGSWYDEQLKEVLREERRSEGDLPQAGGGGHPRRAATSCARSSSRRRRRRPCLARGRPRARLRARGDVRGGDALPRVGRQAEPLRQDPGDEAGARGDRGLHRARQVDQRHADLLAAALRRGRRGLPARARAARRGRRAIRRWSCRSRASSSRASTRRRTSGLEEVGNTTSPASSRSPTRSSPTSTTWRRSRARAGSSSGARAPGRSAACGPRRRRRTRPTATCSTSRS